MFNSALLRRFPSISDARVLSLAAKVKFVIDPDNPYPNNYTGHISVIMKDGSVPQGYPMLVRTSAKEPLDRAAVSSIRASNPFGPLPSAFTGPYIDLLVTYLYNLPLEAANEP